MGTKVLVNRCKEGKVNFSPDENFDRKKATFWGEGKKVPFSFLARVFDVIDKEDCDCYDCV